MTQDDPRVPASGGSPAGPGKSADSLAPTPSGASSKPSQNAKPDTAKPGSPAPAAKAQAPAKPAPRAVAAAPASRRGFLSWLALAWIAFTAAMIAGLTAMARFLFPNVLFEPPSTFKAGPPSEYGIGVVDERWKERFGVWIVRGEDGLYALSTTCTHLGCTPNWLSADSKFKCPCHGSGFYKTGINFEGPAPRPLERYRIVLAEDGQVLVDKSRKYQWEKGQWEDPESLLKA